MIMQVGLPDGGAVELIGSNCKYWIGTGLPDYEGPNIVTGKQIGRAHV